ncbi:MAG: Adaptive-response sensory-kinase SasA [Chroococcidiopsis sp. SAG 2025]|uniref:PAS domain-containing sensor histidine kinase n=1 Tax=Chroococcidiopsis sp. SAG 2025 TaxID=171389 RepID=UPI0029373BB7|nr:PAS domain-containing protein [Chroococcidiopsis sp. SAG 2025]MDV2993957.1 Adaptive-response sensory-kinase SasA [Chroococcidiopsis sp. SAG 2025]
MSQIETVPGELWQTIHPEDRDRYYQQRQQAIACQQAYTVSYRVLAADGNYYWWQEQVIPEASDVPDRQVTCIDRTEVKSTEPESAKTPIKTAQLEAVQQRFQDLVNGLEDTIVWEYDPATARFTFVSQSAAEILGYPVEQWLQQPNFWQNLIHPEDRARVVQSYHQEKLGRDCSLEYRCIAADGRVVWLRDRLHFARDREGKSQLRGLMFDITTAKQTEAELRESEARFRTMADSAPVMIWMAGIDSLWEFANQSWLNFTGRSLKQELGEGWTEAVHPQDVSRCVETYLSAFHSRQEFTQEFRLRRADGKYRWIFEKGSPRFTPDGSFAGYIGCCLDISDRKVSEDALKTRAEELTYLTTVLAQTNVTLEKRNQELDQFAYVASHDLKAPLRAIANLSEWIEEDLLDKLTADTRHQMNLLRGRVHRMEALINGLLQYSRVGRMDTPKSEVSVGDLLAEVVDSLSPPETFSIEIAPMPTIVTEKLPLQQVFTNLISNAIKYHPRQDGKVSISVQEYASNYEFVVADDGEGIAPEYHDKVFGIFQTLSPRDTIESTGIGLAIVKKIVEQQGGTIWLKSQPGQGAAFYFTWKK